MQITIKNATDLTPNENQKTFRVDGEVDGNQFSVDVSPFCGGYDYGDDVSLIPEDDEPVQVAIGEYFDDNNIDVGIVGR